MNRNLPSGQPPPDRDDRPLRRTIVYEYRGDARVGGIAGLVLGALVFAALLGFLVLGAITITLALWIAFGAVLLGAVAAALRAIFGSRGRTPPGPRDG